MTVWQSLSVLGGRGEENWLIYWGEINGSTMHADGGAWKDLDALLTQPIRHASGTTLGIKAVSVDSSDGSRTETVYSYVRDRRARRYMAVKGASEQTSDKREIFSKPSPAVDLNRKLKSHRLGLTPFIVGTTRAKDLIIEGRLPLTGAGPGRMHWYKSVRPDYWEQLTSEIKAPHRTMKNRKVWQKKAGVRNEALDCEVYALHAARSLKVHLLKEHQWAELDTQIRQKNLLDEPDNNPVQPVEVPVVQAVKPFNQPKQTPYPPRSGGFSASRW